MDVCEAPRHVEPADDGGWTQLNVGMSGTGPGSLRDAAWPLFDGLERWVAAARERGPVELWFVRKPPALRLRVRGAGLDVTARQELARLLDAQREAGPVDHWGLSTYEPEVHRLGGPVVIELVHALLSASTDVWLAWERLSRSGQSSLGRDLMVLSLYDELLARSLRANEEAWDVWMTLLRLYDPLGAAPPRRAAGDARARRQRAIVAQATAAEQALLARADAAAEAFATGLGQAHDRCTLAGGRRALLGTLASFFFNLWCLPPATIAALCRVAVRELDPTLDVPPHAPEQHAR
jgi:thiopeptide-type bacteriocin biosynthesis protein